MSQTQLRSKDRDEPEHRDRDPRRGLLLARAGTAAPPQRSHLHPRRLHGGDNDNPTAGHHPGHAEAVEVILDPERISYRDILESFFQIHRPDLSEELVGSDYRSEIFYTSDEQRRAAEDMITAADASGLWPGKVVTKISPAGPFWEAEAEDQDYLQHYPDGKNQFNP
jgi:methionine-S-sulfoxide reductase